MRSNPLRVPDLHFSHQSDNDNRIFKKDKSVSLSCFNFFISNPGIKSCPGQLNYRNSKRKPNEHAGTIGNATADKMTAKVVEKQIIAITQSCPSFLCTSYIFHSEWGGSY